VGGGRLEHPSGAGEGQGKWKLTEKGSPWQRGPVGGRREGGGANIGVVCMTESGSGESVALTGGDL
jgi:hypothetical protein